ncbi:MAG TPA: hypothetical protein VFS20_10920 [Longimicrobium sp.]|nr:hypothetical protein [Longimicrobium sp.]
MGFGDVVQFTRFLTTISKDGGRIVVLVPKRLTSLVASYPAVDEVLARGPSGTPYG